MSRRRANKQRRAGAAYKEINFSNVTATFAERAISPAQQQHRPRWWAVEPQIDRKPLLAAPPVVHADAHDVVGESARLRHHRAQRRRGERLLGLAEVEVGIFELGAPAAAEGALDAGAGGPSGLHVPEVLRPGADAGHGGGRAVADPTIRDAERAIEQEVGRRQEAGARARGTEPLELLAGGDRGQGEHAREGGVAFLAGPLKVGLRPDHPVSELIVVAGLEADDRTVDVLRAGDRADEDDAGIVFRRAPAVADIGAPIVPGPAEDRGGRWRAVGRRQIGGERAGRHQHQQAGGGEHRKFVRSHVESPDVKLVREILIRARRAIRNLIIKQASDVIVGGVWRWRHRQVRLRTVNDLSTNGSQLTPIACSTSPPARIWWLEPLKSSPTGSQRPPRWRARNASTIALKARSFSGRAKPWPSSG